MNKTLQQLLGLEAELKKLSQECSVRATIKSDSLDEMKDAAADLKLHLYHPFELSDMDMFNTYHFDYKIPGTAHMITIKSREEFRVKKELVAI